MPSSRQKATRSGASPRAPDGSASSVDPGMRARLSIGNREVSGLPPPAGRRAAAELVEGRGGAEGNAELQSTVRTQSRAAVSQAQARIREAVNRNRKEKLTALLHHITVDVLRAAFFALKRRAAPGVDAVTW